MNDLAASIPSHPAGESSNQAPPVSGSWPLDTPGGRFHAEWDDQSPVTREGSLIFFFQFLEAGGRWAEFLRGCPLAYSGNRGSGAGNVMGTVLLSVLCGHWRYAHINGIRGDGVNPGLLGMRGTVSEDAVRMAMRRMDETNGLNWLSSQTLSSIAPALGLPWILDIDVTVKPLYGRQEGAAIGYNPHKPGRPSHVYHSYFVANLRISLGVEVRPGNEHAGAKGLPGLWETLDKLPRHQWPTFVRGDCGYGHEAVMMECEERNAPYLFKLRHTLKVKALVQRMMRLGALWTDCGDGWQALETVLTLQGWSRERRVILVREAPARAPAGGGIPEAGSGAVTSAAEAAGKRKRRGRDRQSGLPNATGGGWDARPTPWSGKIAVLVSSLDAQTWPAASMPRQYRDRGDAENCYDELKNQWGWGGFTSRALAPCRLMANLIALFYNWWNLYVRFYDGEHHREAIRSRPMLMSGVGRRVQSGGQRTVKVSIPHGKGDVIAKAIAAISNELCHIRAITERWSVQQRWTLLLTRLLRHWLGGKWLPGLPPEAEPLLSG
ncbi:MAG: transposase [Verrucomicrobiaceae bacterium]|nr:MAG: transposase [Verrucomicrobiaceae bacterium]